MRWFLTGALLVASCADNTDFWRSDNPYDPNGNNYFPPVVTIAPADTTIAIDTDIRLTASSDDKNGTIVEYKWYRGSALSTTTADSIFSFKTSIASVETISVVAIDDDDIPSVPDTSIIFFKGDNPILSSPSAGSSVPSLKVDLQWISGYYDSKFIVFLNTSKEFTGDTGTIVTGNTLQVTLPFYQNTYYWKVMGISKDGDSALSSVASFLTPQLPVPNGITAEPRSSRSILISWKTDIDPVEYVLQAASTENGTFTDIYKGTDRYYLHSGLDRGQNSWYRVKTIQKNQSSSWSERISAKTNANAVVNELGTMMTEQGNFGVETYNNFIYTIGGDASKSFVGKYNPEKGSWSTCSSIPLQMSDIISCKIGANFYTYDGNTGNLCVYRANEDRWQILTSLGKQKSWAACEAYEGKVYIFGGLNSNSIEIYDTLTDSWNTAGNLPTSGYWFDVELVDSLFYMFGLSDDANKCYSYSPKSNTWYNLPDLAQKTHEGATVVIGKEIYFFGGKFGLTVYPRIDIFNITTGKWLNIGNMPHYRDDYNAVELNGRIYILGGYNYKFSGITEYIP